MEKICQLYQFAFESSNTETCFPFKKKSTLWQQINTQCVHICSESIQQLQKNTLFTAELLYTASITLKTYIKKFKEKNQFSNSLLCIS